MAVTFRHDSSTYTLSCPLNLPLAQALLQQADSFKGKDKLVRSFYKAVDSLCRYPLPVTDRDTASQLIGVGSFLASRIESLLTQLQPDFAVFHEALKRSRSEQTVTTTEVEESPTKKQKKLYQPKRNTPAYAMLLTLIQQPSNCSELLSLYEAAERMLKDRKQQKDDEQKEGEKDKNDNGKVMWNAVKKLLSEQLLIKQTSNHQTLYQLTEDGRTVAAALKEKLNGKGKKSKGVDMSIQRTLNSLLPMPRSSSSASTSLHSSGITSTMHKTSSEMSTEERRNVSDSDDKRMNGVQTHSNSNSSIPSFIISPTLDWQILLLIDARERRMNSRSIEQQLQQRGVDCEIRQLSIGDFAWIARHNQHKIEVVLDCLIERKKMSDLCQSIVDGRYAEQRERLKMTQLKRLAYLIEGSIENVAGVSVQAVQSVMASLQMCHQILLHEANNASSSLHFLYSMHQCVVRHYAQHGVIQHNSASNQSLNGEGELYNDFALRMRKSTAEASVSLFGQQLRMIRGVSPSIAQAIISLFPSASTLFTAYTKCSSLQDEQSMLNQLQIGKKGGKTHRVLGLAMSQRIWQFFRKIDYDQHDSVQIDETRLKRHMTVIDEETQIFETSNT